jgi:SH3-like domain-containing protein
MASGALWTLAASLALTSGGAGAAEFRSTSDAAVLYDAPSVRSKPLFALGRDYPLEVIVNVEGWLKVRDIGGTVAWIEKKSVGEKRMLTVRSATADVLAQPEASAQVVFKAEQNVLLELVDPSYATTTPGWAKVRHRDGQSGFVRIQQVWGL